MYIVNNRRIFYTISIVSIVISITAISIWGLKPSIDFTGGSLLQISFGNEKLSADEVRNILNKLNFKDASIRSSGDGFILRLQEISQDEKNTIIQNLSVNEKYIVTEKTFSTIGPVLGSEAVYKSWISVVLVLVAIVLFIAFAFRKVSRPVSSWVYGIVTILALLHDVIIPTGLFAILGHFYGFEVDTLFVTALLVILGFSVHDTIVVFDRVRENLRENEERGGKKSFDQIIGESISQTFVRSINTSFTTLLAVLALYMFGPETIRNFTLALLVGIFIGTYSSIFVGSTLLVTINNLKLRKKK